jgi:hypothetical protein
MGPVVFPKAWLSIVIAAICQSSGMEFAHQLMAGSREAEVQARSLVSGHGMFACVKPESDGLFPIAEAAFIVAQPLVAKRAQNCVIEPP